MNYPIYLIEGPVGAGKSTHAQQLASRLPGVHLALDAWFARLFSPDRPFTDFVPWYLEHKDRLLELMWAHALTLSAQTTPILELGLVQRQARHAFYERCRDAGADLRVQVLDAPRDVRRQRVHQRNTEQGSTFSMVVPDAIFEMASDLWEAPDADEMEDWGIERL